MTARDPGPGSRGRGQRPDQLTRHGDDVAREIDLDRLRLLHTPAYDRYFAGLNAYSFPQPTT